MDPFTTTRERPISADQFASHTSVLERMRVAGAVAQFGPDAAVAVTALLSSPDDESRKLGVAITSEDTLAIARPLLKSRNCEERKLTGIWAEFSNRIKGQVHIVLVAIVLHSSSRIPVVSEDNLNHVASFCAREDF